MDEFETEEQAAARVRTIRCRTALRTAPETAARLRLAMTDTAGRTETGILRELRTPLRTGITDAADELIVVLQSWVDDFSKQMGNQGPRVGAWRNGQTASANAQNAGRFSETDHLGFRAGTTPERASLLTSTLASWLLWHEHDIQDLAGADDFQDEVAQLLWSLRWVAGMSDPRVREVSPRACPICGELEVEARFFGEPFEAAERRGEFVVVATADERRNARGLVGRRILDAVEGVSVRCGHCGWTASPRAAEIVRWLV